MEKTIEEVQEINDPVMPPRILQNVHGYFELASERGKESGLTSKGEGLNTRLDLCHQWDRETVAPLCFKTEDGDAEGKCILFSNVHVEDLSRESIDPDSPNLDSDTC